MNHLDCVAPIRGLVALLLAFVAAFGASSLPQTAKSTGHPKKSMEFEPGTSGELITAGGIELGFTSYRSSDDTSLRVLYGHFKTADEARDALDKELSRAAKTVQRSAKFDGTGKIVGERAEALLQPVGNQPCLHAVMWTDGNKYREIRSHSLWHIMELEKVY